MNTKNKNLVELIDQLNKRNKQIKEARRVDELNKKYVYDMASLGVTVVTLSTSDSAKDERRNIKDNGTNNNTRKKHL